MLTINPFISLNSFGQIIQNSIPDQANEIESKAEFYGRQWNNKAVNESIELFLKASELWKLKKNYIQSINCLIKVSRQYQIVGKQESAYLILQRALNLSRNKRLLSSESQILSEISLLSFEKGNIAESNTYIQKALKKAELSGNSAAMADAYFGYGEILFYSKDLKKSLEFFERSLLMFEANNENEKAARCLLEKGYVLIELNEFETVLQTFNKSLTKWQKTGNIRGQALTYIAFGLVSNLTNQKQKALEFYKKAEYLFPEGIDFFEKAILFNGIGSIYEDYGEWEISLNYRNKAFEFYKQANSQIGQLATYTSLIKLNFAIGNENAALNLAGLAQEQAVKTSAFYYLALIKKDLGFYFLNKDKKKSNYYFEQSRQYFEQNGFKREISTVLSGLSRLNYQRNNSEDLLLYSLKLSLEVQDNLFRADILYNLARLYCVEHKYGKALDFATQSVEVTEHLYSDVNNSNLKRTYFSNVYDRYELYIHLLMQKHKQSPSENFAIQALQASEKSRSRSLLETLRLSEANFTKDANPQTVQKEKDLLNLLNLKANKLTELLSSNAEKSEIDKIDEERRTLENELETIKADLKQQSPVYSAIKNPLTFDVAEFQKNILDEKTVLLEYSFGEKESYLWLIGKNEVSNYVLPAREVLENRIEKIRQAFENRQMLPTNEELEIYQQRLADLDKNSTEESNFLSNELLGQIIDKITDKRLIIVPDGKLSLLPMGALPFPNSDELLINRHEIVYQPSASLLNILPKIQTTTRKASKDLLLFADPVFDDTDNRLTAKNDYSVSTFLGLNLRDFRLLDESGKIPRLFATQNEANSISEIVGKSRSEIVTGFAANRERVLDSTISDYRILHFATHGLVDVKRPEVSSIVLSQFDEGGQKQEGFLRLQDIYSLNLSTDLVVLSACQSGVGKEIKGEGLMSLNNAFLQAGAKSVLSSAWKVDDDATAEFMKRFYANLINKQLNPSESLRQTQLEMVNETQFKSPFYWAAFTIQGEYRQPILISRSYFYLILLAILALIGMGLIWRYKIYKFHWMKKL